MNIEHIALGIKDAHGLDMSDEAAITLLRHALPKLAEHVGEPVGFMDDQGVLYEIVDGNQLPSDVPLYTEPQLIAAQQRTAEACAKVCDRQAKEPERASYCAEAIRNGEWRVETE